MINYVTKFRIVLVRPTWGCRLDYECTILSAFPARRPSYAEIYREFPGWGIEGIGWLSEEPVASIDMADNLNFTFTVNQS